jgi:flagellar hook-associated protein 1 FlgK
MSGLFYGLEIAKTGLYVSQKGLKLSGNNIANANTEGYTRQRLVIESLYPSTMSRLNIGLRIGGGANVKQIDQIRSAYIDRQLRGQYSALGEWNTRSTEMEFIVSLINETKDATSLSSALASFYDSLSKLAEHPESLEIRTNVQQNAIKLCETFNYYYNQLVDQQNAYNDSIQVTVNSINSLAKSIADYNKQIFAYELGGHAANELRDQRALLVDKLSQLVNIEYSENANGQLTITTNGQTLVSNNSATMLQTSPDVTTGFYDILYEGADFNYDSGELEAYRLLRDGTTVEEMGIPYLLSNLNTLAQSLAQSFNEVHETGYTIPIGAGASLTGIQFFDVPAGGYAAITAGNIALSAEVLADGRNIAASDAPIDLNAEDTGIGNYKIAQKLYELTTSKTIAGIGSFDDFLTSFVVQVGIACSSAQDMSESQTAIVDNLETRRESISGVSIDDEMINILSFQHSYAAAARVLTAIDEAIGILINNTGRVGL